MHHMNKETYFLGSNSANGFYSAYSHFCTPEDGNFLWVIKGGPGCGKSSFMRKIGKAAEEAGLDVEYVLCSGDPDSLDGVYIPQKKLGYVDGTAPHILDVSYPGVHGLYLDLGQFYDIAALAPAAENIKDIYIRYKSMYDKAYALLSAIPRSYKPTPLPAGCKKRFHTAICCKGIVTQFPKKERVSVSDTELDMLIKDASKKDVVYLHPLWPDRAQAYYSSKNDVFYCAEADFPPLEDAILYLNEAKKLHDELEKYYNPHVKFHEIYAFAEKHIQNYMEDYHCNRA